MLLLLALKIIRPDNYAIHRLKWIVGRQLWDVKVA